MMKKESNEYASYHGALPVSQKYNPFRAYLMYTGHPGQLQPFFTIVSGDLPRAQNSIGFVGYGRLGQIPQLSIQILKFSFVSSTGNSNTSKKSG